MKKTNKVMKRFKCKLCLLTNRDIRARKICVKCWALMFRPSGSPFSGMDFIRQQVRIRDKFTCQKCKKKWVEGTRRFDIHHLGGLCGQLSRSYDRSAGMKRLTTLCHKCHLNLEEVREKMRNNSSLRPNKPKVDNPA